MARDRQRSRGRYPLARRLVNTDCGSPKDQLRVLPRTVGAFPSTLSVDVMTTLRNRTEQRPRTSVRGRTTNVTTDNHGRAVRMLHEVVPLTGLIGALLYGVLRLSYLFFYLHL